MSLKTSTHFTVRYFNIEGNNRQLRRYFNTAEEAVDFAVKQYHATVFQPWDFGFAFVSFSRGVVWEVF